LIDFEALRGASAVEDEEVHKGIVIRVRRM
jgi:hypothetical protein